MCQLIYILQAVGIFGHMTANNPLNPSGGQGAPSTSPSHTDPIEGSTREVEKTLEDLNASIESTLEESALRTSVPRPGEEEKQRDGHFTLASSPTRRNDRDS